MNPLYFQIKRISVYNFGRYADDLFRFAKEDVSFSYLPEALIKRCIHRPDFILNVAVDRRTYRIIGFYVVGSPYVMRQYIPGLWRSVWLRTLKDLPYPFAESYIAMGWKVDSYLKGKGIGRALRKQTLQRMQRNGVKYLIGHALNGNIYNEAVFIGFRAGGCFYQISLFDENGSPKSLDLFFDRSAFFVKEGLLHGGKYQLDPCKHYRIQAGASEKNRLFVSEGKIHVDPSALDRVYFEGAEYPVGDFWKRDLGMDLTSPYPKVATLRYLLNEISPFAPVKIRNFLWKTYDRFSESAYCKRVVSFLSDIKRKKCWITSAYDMLGDTNRVPLIVSVGNHYMEPLPCAVSEACLLRLVFKNQENLGQEHFSLVQNVYTKRINLLIRDPKFFHREGEKITSIKMLE